MGFHNTWNMVLSELHTVPDPEVLQLWYFKQQQYFKPMAEDIAHYKRAKWNGSPDHSFEWLWAASCRYLSMKREDYMQDSLNRSLKRTHATTLAQEPRSPQRRRRAPQGWLAWTLSEGGRQRKTIGQEHLFCNPERNM